MKQRRSPPQTDEKTISPSQVLLIAWNSPEQQPKPTKWKNSSPGLPSRQSRANRSKQGNSVFQARLSYVIFEFLHLPVLWRVSCILCRSSVLSLHRLSSQKHIGCCIITHQVHSRTLGSWRLKQWRRNLLKHSAHFVGLSTNHTAA